MARTIMILGQSGRGKSFSLRNLPVKPTIILNHERKTLPFKGSSKFNELRPKNVKETFNALDKIIADKAVKVVVIESLSAFLDMLLAEARILHKNWDVFTHYNEKIYYLFERIRKLNDAGKHTIVISHNDININDLTGETTINAKVKGQEWKGAVEKEFDIVVHAEMNMNEDGTPEYHFRTQTDGLVPAKAPYEMFDDILIENDMNFVLKKVHEYDKT